MVKQTPEERLADSRMRAKARNRALIALAAMHRAEYRELYRIEVQSLRVDALIDKVLAPETDPVMDFADGKWSVQCGECSERGEAIGDAGDEHTGDAHDALVVWIIRHYLDEHGITLEVDAFSWVVAPCACDTRGKRTYCMCAGSTPEELAHTTTADARGEVPIMPAGGIGRSGD